MPKMCDTEIEVIEIVVADDCASSECSLDKKCNRAIYPWRRDHAIVLVVCAAT